MVRRRGVAGVVSVVLTCLLAMATVLTVTAAPAQAVDRNWRSRMLAAVNALRVDAGVSPVRLCPRLTQSAQAYAVEMAQTRTFGHIGPDGAQLFDRITAVGYRARVAGENLGAGQKSVAEVMQQWRESPAHLADLLDPRFRHVGFGYVAMPTGAYPTYWVQHFGVGGSC